VKKQHKLYCKNLKQKKPFNSRYQSEEERIAYAETVWIPMWVVTV